MKFGIALVFSYLLCLCGPSFVWANSAVDETLKDENYPWYDVESRQFKPVSIPSTERQDLSTDSELSQETVGILGIILRVLMWSLIIVVLVGLIAFCVRAFSDLEPAPVSIKEDGPVVTQEQLAALPEMARGVTDFLAEARRLAASQQYSQAMIFYYAWQLVTLGNQEIVELKAGKTNRQYVREATKNQPAIKELFHQSVRKFEDAIYGGFELSHDEFLSLWQLRNQFKEPAAKQTLFGKGR